MDESQVLAALRAGDEAVFAQVVAGLQPTLRRLARSCLREDALIDEVVQDTWLAVISGLERFEARASFRTWVCRILLNRARTTAVRAARSAPISSLGADDEGPLDLDRFRPDGRWSQPPGPWADEDPASVASRKEILDLLDRALDDLPARQRQVVLLRDVQGWSADEVCNALDLSESNQRVLLHRGRARLREAVEASLAMTGTPT
jgi:RNA polymerase sigma-70 factor, ECF subfamily